MTGRQSSATDRALERVRQGETAYAAAKAEGISLSTIYRALARALNTLKQPLPPPRTSPDYEFETRVCGIPCTVRIVHWEPLTPAHVNGPPEDCYPAEGGSAEWELLDGHGRRALWLERKMSPKDRSRLEDAIFDHMLNL